MSHIVFLHQDPHPVHDAWAQSIGAMFLHYRLGILESWRRRVKLMEWLLKKVSRCFYRLYPFHDVGAILVEGGAPLPEATLIKRKLQDVRLILLAADPLFSKPPIRELESLLKMVDGVIAVSEMVKSDAIKILGQNVQIDIVYPFVNIEKFKRINPDMYSHNILFIADHWPTKGIFLLPSIFKLVKKDVKDAKFFILGRSTRYTSWLRRKDLESEGFHVVGYKDPAAYFRQCCILLHPAVYDSFSCVVIEAMSAGLIPIISNRTGAKEILKEYQGKLVLKLDVESFADRIIEILNMPLEEKLMLSRELRKRALSDQFTRSYSIKKFKRTFLKLAVQ